METENKYKLLFDNIPIGVLIFDDKLKIIDCNKHLTKITGFKSTAIADFDLNKIENQTMLSAYKTALKGIEGFFEGEYNSKQINLPALMIRTKPMDFEIEGKMISGGIALIEDITDRKIVEDAINKLYNTFQTILDSVDLSVYAVDTKTKEILFVNEKTRNEFGDISGKKYNEIFTDTPKDDSGNDLLNYEYFNEKLKKWYKYSNTIIKWIDGREVLLISATDINLLKETDAELKEKNSELEFQATEIERALLRVMEQNAQINEQSEELKLSSQVKDKMFSIIGHDLRGPVGNIKSVLDLLMEDYDDYSKEEIKEFIEPVIDTSGSAFNLLSNLLWWAKNQTGKISLNPENFVLNDLIEENVNLFAVNFDNKKIKLTIDIKKEFTIRADENMINTAIRNLISNAIKFTPEKGNVTVKIRELKTENKIQVSVKDNGIGISKEDIDKILKKREMFTTYGTNNEKGSGLGTVLCREFIEKNNGTFEISSTKGKGSIFSFKLPL